MDYRLLVYAVCLTLILQVTEVRNDDCVVPGCICFQEIIISCSNANLTKLPDPKTIPASYLTMEFINNSISRIDNAHYPYITTLTISRCQVTEIAPDGFSNMTNLQQLDLSDNMIGSIKSSMFQNLPNLTTLTLDNNKLTELSADSLDPTEMPLLTQLSVTHNLITTVAESALKFPLLETLDLGFNQLALVPSLLVWQETPLLKTLILHSNPISSVSDDQFLGLSQLQFLHLDACKLTSLPSNVFTSLNALKRLHLGDNQLTKFDVSLLDPFRDSLTMLHLYINKLTTLDGAVEQLQSKQLVDLDLWDNPWTCDCRIQWMNKLHTNTTYAQNPRCYLPESVRNQTVVEGTKKLNCAPSSSTSTTVGLAVCIPLALIFVAAVAYFLKKHKGPPDDEQANLVQPRTKYT